MPKAKNNKKTISTAQFNTAKNDLKYAEFICSSLIEEAKQEEKPYKLLSIVKGINGDLSLSEGINRFDNKKTIVKVITNLTDAVIDNINTYDLSSIDQYIVITKIQKETIRGKIKDKNINNKIHFLDKEYVWELAKEHKFYWWRFATFVAADADIALSEDGKDAILYAPNYLKIKDCDYAARLPIDEINKISELNEEDFKNRIHKNGNDINAALFVGNGVSIPLGSMGWGEMLKHFKAILTPHYVDNIEEVNKSIGDNAYTSSKLASNNLSKKDYINVIRTCIYNTYDKNTAHKDDTYLRSVTKIKVKYPNVPITTYNYDSMLENDYKLVTNKNIAVANSAKENKMNEPKIVHIHGYIPYDNIKDDSNRKIILNQDDYLETYKGSSWVVTYQKKLLKDYNCLFVGSSLSDVFQISLINTVKKQVERLNKNALQKNKLMISINDYEYWKCYALIPLIGLSNKDILIILKYFQSQNIYVIFVRDYSKLPAKLDSLFNSKYM